MASSTRHQATAISLTLIALYLPLAIQLLLNRAHWDTASLSLWILLAPGQTVLVILWMKDLIPGDWPQWTYLALAAGLSAVFITGLVLLCRQNRRWQYAAFFLALGLGVAAAWVCWTLQAQAPE